MIGYQDKINQILRGAETIKNMNMDNFYGKDVPEVKSTTTSTFRYNDDALVDAKTINAYIEEAEELKKEAEAQDFLKQILVKDLEIMEQEIKILDAKIDDVKLERDALWVKTQEDERIINDLNDAVKEKTEQRDEAIRLATLFQALYLRYGKAEDESYSTLLVKKGFESLANLKGLGYFGEEEA